MFYFAETMSRDREVAQWTAFFTATGVRVIVGLYSYFLSNFLGLILIQTSLALLFQTLEEQNRTTLVLSTILASLCIFTHPWTLDHYIIGVIGLTIIFAYKKRKDDKATKRRI